MAPVEDLRAAQEEAEAAISHYFCVLCERMFEDDRGLCGKSLSEWGEGEAVSAVQTDDCVVCADIFEETEQCRRGHWLRPLY